MLRFEVSEQGQPALPAIDLAETVVIGSSTTARIRLPATVAHDAHVRIEGTAWLALADVRIDGIARAAGEGGPIGAGVELELGPYRVRIAPAPAGTAASPPQRTESLARELVRSLLGSDAAPTLELESGRGSRTLAPPESALVIGRGDDAGWVILDEDLSREHCEIRRGWDGVTIRDLDSKNGTRLDGSPVRAAVELHDGARIQLGKVALRFRDPAERHLRGGPPPPKPAGAVPRRGPAWPFVMAVALAGLAAVGLAWVLAS